MKTAKYWIDQLDLLPHPEGGYYKETYRNTQSQHFNGKTRNYATSIYFLIEAGKKSHFHQLTSDEIWYFHHGMPLTICMFTNNGDYIEKQLGSELHLNQSLQITIPSGYIFGAYLREKTGYSLMGCMVNPGFDFEDFKMINKAELMHTYPEQENIIEFLSIE